MGNKYKVVKDFTDATGKQYRKGDMWQGSDEDAQAQVQQGNLQQDTSQR